MIIFYGKDGKEMMRVKGIEHMNVNELYDEEAKVAAKLSTNAGAKDYLDSIHKEMKRRSL